ncbi:TetR/AcrR family transcriptional regulator [Methylobacterium sp.]|uniref:TetR/AcrR family transcriptional regulator n=1 Tax=Methylobacterium sp. TaxID=409 RepID=UPI00257AF258|nr:TetR/AcrR family transcriptional regulator [Methylobacterium sp.]
MSTLDGDGIMSRGEVRRGERGADVDPEADLAAASPDTRTRILAVSLALFNARGLGHVTTAEIAAAAGIREGNLQYHFPRKRGLVEALFAAFETEAVAVAGRMPADPAAPEALLAYQRAWFDLMWRYRCVYRDGIAMVEIAPALRARVHTLRAETQAAPPSRRRTGTGASRRCATSSRPISCRKVPSDGPWPDPSMRPGQARTRRTRCSTA